MDEITKLLKKIEDHGKKNYSIGAQSNEIINDYEEKLNCTLPDDYKIFLNKYGYCSVSNVEIFGIDPEGFLDVIKKTDDFREYGLPKEYVHILSYGELNYFLDTSRLVNGICPVIEWEIDSSGDEIENKSFNDFLAEQLNQLLNDLI